MLNAKYHEMEAQIVAQAGKFGAVTIATNMAGRGTDIMLLLQILKSVSRTRALSQSAVTPSSAVSPPRFPLAA